MSRLVLGKCAVSTRIYRYYHENCSCGYRLCRFIQCDVVAVDIVEEKVSMLNNKQSPIMDVEIEEFLANRALSFQATTDKQAYQDAEFVIIATPTDYDPKELL